MECHELIEYLLGSDPDAPMPEAVSRHLDSCASCAARQLRLDQALHSLTSGLDEPASEADTERIMAAVRAEAENSGQPTTLRSWVIPGTLLVAGLLGLRFSEVMNWLRMAMGPGIDVAMSLILGIFLTAYICMLVGVNLRRVQRVLRVRLRG